LLSTWQALLPQRIRSGGASNVALSSPHSSEISCIPVWSLGFFLAARTPSPALFVPTAAAQAVGWSIIAAGSVIIIVALIALGLRAIAPSTQDALAQTGLYAYVRHPIHTGTLLEFIGLFIVTPTQTVTLACVLGMAWALVQTKLEEYDLLQRLPAYRDYMDRVPRFLPSLWTK
jgi:protein-S-isoprenylcysteine O-methyltransferase Ste14